MGKAKKLAQENLSDLASLSSASSDKIATCLRSRYDTFNIYTNIGSRHLVIVNPLKELSLNDDQTSLEYVAAYKDPSGKDRIALDTHIFDLVNRVYSHMRRTGSDQNIVLRGESGSGKSETRKLTVRHLVRLSSHRKESKVQIQIMESQKVLEAFGSCQLSNSTSGSRFGYYGEVQFNERGRMIGCKNLHYFLEKSRVTGDRSNSSSNEGNFHVFYYLLAGVSPEERAALQLPTSDPSHYTYLSKYKRHAASVDAAAFNQLKASLKSSGFRKEHIARIIQLLAAILHLGNIIFVDPTGTSNQEAAYVKNTDQLEAAADLLGLDPHALENVLTFKTTMIRKDITTLILNSEQARIQCNELCQVLYSLLFSWMVEHINRKTCVEDFNSFIGLLDFPGLQTGSLAGFEQLCVNFANEQIQQYVDHYLFELEIGQFQSEGINTPDIHIDDSAMNLFTRPKGICDLVNNMSDATRSGKRSYNDSNVMDSLVKFNSTHPSFKLKTADTGARHFCVQHFGAPVEYKTDGFISENNGQISVDFVSLFRGGMDIQPSWNAFVVDLFADANIQVENHPKHNSAIVGAQQSAKPMRAPSQRRSTRRKAGTTEKTKTEPGSTKPTAVLNQLQAALDELVQSFEEAKLWVIYCIAPRPMNSKSNSGADAKYIAAQIEAFHIPSILQLPSIRYIESFNHEDFLERYHMLFDQLDTSRLLRSQCEMAAGIMGWSASQMYTTQNKVFLSGDIWRELEDQLRSFEKVEQRQAKDNAQAESKNDSESVTESHPFAATAAAAGLPLPTMQHYNEDQASYYSEDESGQYYEHEGSYYGSESFVYSDPKGDNNVGLVGLQKSAPIQENLDESVEDETKMTSGRKRWLFFVMLCTWWVPSKFMVWCGRMKRKDVRVAWREKVTLCMLIFLMCAFVIWFLIFFSEVICPKQHVFSQSELQNHNQDSDKKYVAIRGEVFDIGSFAPHHYPQNLIPQSSVLSYAGQDVTNLFPIQVSALCEGTTGEVSPYVSFDYNINLTDTNGKYHDFRYSSEDYSPNWYYDQMTLLRKNYKVGNLGFEYKAISDQAKSATMINGQNLLRIWGVIDGRIYDLTSYSQGGRYARGPPGEAVPTGIDTNFMSQQVVDLFMQKAGSDITKDFNELNIDPVVKQRQLVCLRNLFYAGELDTRNSPKCQFSTYLLLIITCLLAAVIVFKFIAAVRFGAMPAPEEHDKFAICQVTCYTEDEESLKKTIDSIATLHYDDKRKLLFIVCDGMIVGSGNDLPTPRIVLNILGVDPQVDPEALSFVSVGDGMKQHNTGKIYSGLYEVAGHVVPYIVVVKCGNPHERQKPGNRGKRDSQLVLMQFLNRVHYDGPMNPLQLEIYHQMKNVIGVSPDMYDFVLMVDADTEVMRDGLNYLVSSAVHDSKIIGICGETTLANEKDSWVTMIQVYEYFISHHMIKSFESLFSTVSCLPGCFTMYRIRTVDRKRALFMSNEIIADYSVNVVDTLHKKNLLHLGEDRYLTTLLLKHFPNFKTKFTPHAQCKTNAPDLWSVLVSQRRRWINSTIHNLGELVFLPRLCGFCCFSMRFVVLLDLISTLVMPAILAYLGYLIYTLATLTEDDDVPIISIATIAGTYALQALLFAMKGRWEFIGWMLVSILAIPVFSFYIPIYSYWHFDDFSWGNTRVVVGDGGKKVAVAVDEGKFDPKSIPTMKWSEYERAVLSEENWSDNMSQGSSSGYTYNSRSNRMPTPSHAPSMYGMGTMGGDNMSVYSGMAQNTRPITPQNVSMMFDRNSVAMPSSASLPMMNYANSTQMMPMQSSRSMASFAPQKTQSFISQSGQFIPMQQQQQQSNQFVNSSSHSLMMDGFNTGDGPRNEEILTEVQRILSTADLTKITKKQVREELQNLFGVSMTSRKDYINACIENVLQNRA